MSKKTNTLLYIVLAVAILVLVLNIGPFGLGVMISQILWVVFVVALVYLIYLLIKKM